jgi:tRNA pseudouridine13 synthase
MSGRPRALGPPGARGAIRSEPGDFRVEERLGFEPDGAGEHVLLLVEKRATNTHWVARALAEHAGVKRVDVGYAGSKDRHAVARQWFTVRVGAGAEPDWDTLAAPGVRILARARHRRKLKHGAHRGNAFVLRVRALRGDTADLEARLHAVARDGVPNYFGAQRYGLGNVETARALFAGARVPRVQRGFALSAARSALFDAVLAERVAAGTWKTLLDGDVANLAGSASWFPVERADAELARRAQELDLHPTGPLWGRGELATRGVVRALEERVASAHEDLARGLEDAGLEQARRALRVVPEGLRWEIARDELALSFALPPGTYATSVLNELIEAEDKGGAHAGSEEGL